MNLKRLGILMTILLIATLISSCSSLEKQSSDDGVPNAVTGEQYAVIDKSTGGISQYLLNITNCEAISLDVISEWVETCEDVDGYYDYIYSDSDSWDIFLYVPHAQELFGDIQNSDIEIEIIDNVLKIYIDTTNISRKEKKSDELIIHFLAPVRGSWPRASELYIDGSQIENLDTAFKA